MASRPGRGPTLLQGSDIGDGDGDGAAAFEERILALVLAALAGKNVDEETRLAERSIEEAKAELAREEATINTMLGSMDGAEYLGPRAPTLPGTIRSMAPRDFTLAAFQTLGAHPTPMASGLFLVQENGGREYVRFDEHTDTGVKSALYAPGSAPFQRLLGRVIASGVHDVKDRDRAPAKGTEEIAREWVEDFGAMPKTFELLDARRSFGGTALLRVRATVAHDSYERLVEVPCSPDEHRSENSRSALTPLTRTIDNPAEAGVDVERLTETARRDEAISEFARFYLERREQEVPRRGRR